MPSDYFTTWWVPNTCRPTTLITANTCRPTSLPPGQSRTRVSDKCRVFQASLSYASGAQVWEIDHDLIFKRPTRGNINVCAVSTWKMPGEETSSQHLKRIYRSSLGEFLTWSCSLHSVAGKLMHCAFFCLAAADIAPHPRARRTGRQQEGEVWRQAALPNLKLIYWFDVSMFFVVCNIITSISVNRLNLVGTS